ncbi:hypothetical protein MNBD_GAMMA12-13 [hydrothermal vent metagenome]|uniref:Uncharacterized protein n=1 Tax=hydrothermal vent metagenome TaxID=652676 RepID=A0A3B0YBX8_9ZZZZ
MSEAGKNIVTKALLKAVWWLCQPLVKLLINKGITYPVLCDLLKSVYVKTAHEQVELDGKTPSLSRIFVKTGINRKEIKRILNEVLTEDEPVFKTTSLGALLVSRWLATAEFCDQQGEPKKLARVTDKNSIGFKELVESVSKDIHPRALLDDWLALGIVVIDDQDRVCLRETSFVPHTGFDEKIYFFGRNITDHIDTCVHNLLETKQAMFERSVFYSCLSPESVKKLQTMAVNQSKATLNILNKEALKLKAQDIDSSNPETINNEFRFRYGCYWFDNTNNSDMENKK